MGVPVETLAAPDFGFVVDVPVFDLEECYFLYRENGGILPKERYQEFLNMQMSGVQTKGIRPPSIQQALGMARFTGLGLSRQEVLIYGHLRQIMKDPEQEESNDPQTDVYSLSDQRLLAEILLMEGRLDDHQLFTSAYPNIFGKGT